MKLNNDLTLREIAGEYMIINPYEMSTENTGVYALNETAAYLWENLLNYHEFTKEDAISILCKEYDIDRETATEDLDELFNNWERIGFLINE